MQIIHGRANELSSQMAEKLAQYRYDIFIHQLKWDLDVENGRELDEFDRDDTVYVIATEGEDICGCARLLPTTRPYLLSEKFPELLDDEPAPASERIWELSRFACGRKHGMAAGVPQQRSLAGRLLDEAMRTASKQGAERLITVSPTGIERLLSRLGVDASRVAPPLEIKGSSLCSYWIPVTTTASN